MALTDTQLPEKFRQVIDEQIELFNDKRSIQIVNSIPKTTEIPIKNPAHWLRIPDVICVFADMVGSTQLSAVTQDKQTAGAYQLFTGTAVRLFNAFEAPYIDVRGDGAFALFNSDQPYRALAAAVTLKTFAQEEFVPRMKKKTESAVGCHIGIDQKTVLVRKLGLMRIDDRTDRQNEVWAGKPVNMAAKLAALAEDKQLLASDRYYENIPHEKAQKTCGCEDGKYTGNKKPLWEEADLSGEAQFDFDKAHLLKSYWCSTHGQEYCYAILALDEA